MSVHYAEGVYVCRVKGQELSTSHAGNLQLKLVFRVLGKPDPENPDNYLQAKQQNVRSSWLVLTEKTPSAYARDHLNRLGWRGESFTELDPTVPGFHSFRDLVIDFYCKHETKQGSSEQVERWSIASRPVVAAKPPRQDKVKELDAVLAKRRQQGNGAAS